jgi:hypothetical protein
VTLGAAVGRFDPSIVILSLDAFGRTELMTGTVPVARTGAGPMTKTASAASKAATTRRTLRSCNIAITSIQAAT